MSGCNTEILLPESINTLPVYCENEIRVSILRLDRVHPVISGNKLFKLYYYLQEAAKEKVRPIATFGGAYSNHLAATAHACKKLKIECIGVVRGNKNEMDSLTLTYCRQQGMQLKFLDRETFRQVAEHPERTDGLFPENAIVVPLGGFSAMGARGAALICNYIPKHQYTHICMAAGTAATLAGLLLPDRQEKVLAFPVLKGMTDIKNRLIEMGVPPAKRLEIHAGFHFGGYAKMNRELIDFMNWFYDDYGIPLDFVYTAKMMHGVFSLIKEGHFPKGSKILAIHTGGLQGNQSLPVGTLHY